MSVSIYVWSSDKHPMSYSHVVLKSYKAIDIFIVFDKTWDNNLSHGSCYMLAVTYIYVSDFFSLSRIETRQVLEPHLSCLKILSFQIKISPKAKKKPTTLLLSAWVSQKVHSWGFLSHVLLTQNKRNQMFQVFIYFNHSYVLSFQSYLPQNLKRSKCFHK